MKKPNITEGEWEVSKHSNTHVGNKKSRFVADTCSYMKAMKGTKEENEANAQAISAIPNVVNDYTSLLYAIENNKTDSGAVMLGDDLESSIKETAKKMGFLINKD